MREGIGKMERTTRIEISSGNRVFIRTASGTFGATFDGQSLSVIGSKQIMRLTAEKSSEIAAAFASARPARRESDTVEVFPGQTAPEGYEFVGTRRAGDAYGELPSRIYSRVAEIEPGVYPVVMLGQMDLVK